MRKTLALLRFLCYPVYAGDRMTLKELRKQKNLTQKQCAEYIGMPLRTYQNYENDEAKAASLKYEFMLEKLEKYGITDETHGVLTVDRIKEASGEIFSRYKVEYAYLFGSYAKGQAKPESDVDLLVASDESGLKFYELTEELREGLRKRVDVLNLSQLRNNPELVNEILKDGVKIYG